MKAVIFDLDGCLAESEVLCLTAFAEELSAEGIGGYDWLVVRDRFLGRSIPEILRLIEAETGKRPGADFAQRFEARVRPLYERALQPVPGAVALLSALGEVPRAIATGGSLVRMGFTLEIAGLKRFFAHGYSGEQVARGKPHPDLFLFAAEKLGVAPQDCIVLEDSPHGVTGAVAAGMLALGFTGGTHLAGIEASHAEKLRAAGAAEVVDTLAAAQDWILARLT